MKNNFWEEKNMKLNVKDIHKNAVDKMNLPNFAKIKCPYCKQMLSPNSIRTIGLKFNARNIGDIIVEFACDNCDIMNVLYYRDEAKDIGEFIDILNNKKELKTKEPVLEDDMYKLQYNNLIEKRQ